MPTRLPLIVVALLFVLGCGFRPDSSADTSVTTAPEPVTTERESVSVEPAVAAVGALTDGELETSDGRTRTYHLYVPAALPAGPVPLLVALHGGTGSGTQFQKQSNFDGLAEANGFIVVFPDGVGLGRNADKFRTWNAGYCCGTAVKQSVDDVAFIADLIDMITVEYEIDTSRIFAAGHSNGGMFAYRLACELSDRIVAIGLQAGSLGIDECLPSQPVSVLHIHGTADQNHPIDGGVGANSISNVSYRSAMFSATTAAAAMGCESEPTDSVDAANPDLMVSSWTSCPSGVEVQLVAVSGASHAWMGHPAAATSLVGESYADLDASMAVLTFLLDHPRNLSTT